MCHAIINLESIVNKRQNALLHLAVVVGYVRHTLKIVERADLATCSAFSRAHLEQPDFKALPDSLRSVAASEIFELVKDGASLPNHGQDFIAAVIARQYGVCWELANRVLHVRAPGYDKVEPVDIKPEWLA